MHLNHARLEFHFALAERGPLHIKFRLAEMHFEVQQTRLVVALLHYLVLVNYQLINLRYWSHRRQKMTVFAVSSYWQFFLG